MQIKNHDFMFFAALEDADLDCFKCYDEDMRPIWTVKHKVSGLSAWEEVLWHLLEDDQSTYWQFLDRMKDRKFKQEAEAMFEEIALKEEWQ